MSVTVRKKKGMTRKNGSSRGTFSSSVRIRTNPDNTTTRIKRKEYIPNTNNNKKQ